MAYVFDILRGISLHTKGMGFAPVHTLVVSFFSEFKYVFISIPHLPLATRWLNEIVGFTGLSLTYINIANVIADRRIQVSQCPETPCFKSRAFRRPGWWELKSRTGEARRSWEGIHTAGQILLVAEGSIATIAFPLHLWWTFI